MYGALSVLPAGLFNELTESTIIDRLTDATATASSSSAILKGFPEWYHIAGPDVSATYDIAVLKAIISIGVGQVEGRIDVERAQYKCFRVGRSHILKH